MYVCSRGLSGLVNIDMEIRLPPDEILYSKYRGTEETKDTQHFPLFTFKNICIWIG